MIRPANKFDIPKIINMLWNYHDHGNLPNMEIKDDETAKRILTHLIVLNGGIAIVSEVNTMLNGMLLAVRTPYLWDNNRFVMNEIAYWVEPEYRGGTVGYRLLKEYINQCDDLKDQGKITNYTISQMEGQELNYSRFGFRPTEHTWSI